MSVKEYKYKNHIYRPVLWTDKEIEDMKARSEAIQRQYWIDRNRKECFTDKALREYTFETDDGRRPLLSRIGHNYVIGFSEYLASGKGLLLYGTVGTGKTFISACIAHALIDQGYSCCMTTFPRVSNELFETQNKQEYLNSLMRYDLLIIDDLATERNSEYMNEIVFSVIDERCRSKKPLIVTTNLTGVEFEHPASVDKSRIYSRLFEMCIPFKIDGEDRRKKLLSATYKHDTAELTETTE